jgi:hypothetical protein
VVEALDLVFLFLLDHRCLLKIELDQLSSLSLVPYVISVDIDFMLPVQHLVFIILVRIEVSSDIDVTLWEELLSDAKGNRLNNCEK